MAKSRRKDEFQYLLGPTSSGASTLAYSGPRALPSQFNAVLEPLNGKEYLAVKREHFEFWDRVRHSQCQFATN